MYKILVTTMRRAGSSDGGVSVHTLVIEFDSVKEADIAVEIMNNVKDQPYYQSAIKLYL